MTAKLMVISGSLRKASHNKRLARLLAKMAEESGAEVTLVELNDYPLPLFDEDVEQSDGLHPNAVKLKEIMNASDGFIFVSPEYNGSYSGVLKNAIDFASRQIEGEGILESFKDKYAALFATSPGGFGGLRGLMHLRVLLSGIGTNILADQIAIPKAQDAFTEEGFASEKRAANVRKLVEKLVSTIEKVKAV